MHISTHQTLHNLHICIACLLRRSHGAILFLQWSSCVCVNVCTGAVAGVGVVPVFLPFMLSDWGWLMARLTLFPSRCSCYPFIAHSFLHCMLPFFYLFILRHSYSHSYCPSFSLCPLIHYLFLHPSIWCRFIAYLLQSSLQFSPLPCTLPV